MSSNSAEDGPGYEAPREVEALLDRLRRANILHRVTPHGRGNGVIHVEVTGERWEIEYFENHPIEVEVFISTGEIAGEAALERLFQAHADIFPKPAT